MMFFIHGTFRRDSEARSPHVMAPQNSSTRTPLPVATVRLHDINKRASTKNPETTNMRSLHIPYPKFTGGTFHRLQP